MERYQAYLHRTVTVALWLLGLLSLFTATVTMPLVTFLADTAPWEDLIPFLSLSLAVLSCCRLLSLWQKGTLSKGDLASFLLLGLAAALTLPLTEKTPLLYRGYVFPCFIGMTLPRALLSLLPARRRHPRLTYVAFFACATLLVLLLCLSLAAELAFDPLSRALFVRASLLSVMILGQCFAFLSARCDLASLLTALAVGLLPIPHILAIRRLAHFRIFPLFFVLFVTIFLLELLLRKKSCR